MSFCDSGAKLGIRTIRCYRLTTNSRNVTTKPHVCDYEHFLEFDQVARDMVRVREFDLFIWSPYHHFVVGVRDHIAKVYDSASVYLVELVRQYTHEARQRATHTYTLPSACEYVVIMHVGVVRVLVSSNVDDTLHEYHNTPSVESRGQCNLL